MADTLFFLCQAAVLPDEAACHLLQGHLASYTEGDYVGELTLFALAWFDPEAALRYYDTLWPDAQQGIDRSWLEAYKEAQQLQGRSIEEMAVYYTITALLPQDSPEAEKRQRARWLYCARWSPKEFFALPQWNHGFHWNVFVFARVWLAASDLLRERIVALPGSEVWSDFYYSLSQMLLVAQGQPSGISRLIDIIQEFLRMEHYRTPRLEVYALGYSLGFLRVHAPKQAIELIPELVALLSQGREESGTTLTTHVLILLADVKLDTTLLLLPLKERVEQDPKRDTVRIWLRSIQRSLPEFTAEPDPAQELVRILRLFLLVRRLKETLLQRKRRATPARIRRAWRWLQYCERLITTVSDPFWRGELLEKKASLEAQVRESRRPVHRALCALFDGDAL